jgi:hypothetical protein
MWLVLLVPIAITYTRLDPKQLHNVSHRGLDGGLSRVLVAVNFPISLVAVALLLIALDALPAQPAWWVGAPALALCAVTAWPGVVNEDDLDARLVNLMPALGVILALALTAAATKRAGAGLSPRMRFDTARITIAGAVLVASLPWIAAELGFFLPNVIFLTGRSISEPDGTSLAAVHHGHHHGLDGALLVSSALLLSRARVRSRSLATATRISVSLLFAYGSVNFAQDLWGEQIVKRGWTSRGIPPALEPRLAPIWLVTLAIATMTAWALRSERKASN